MGVARTLMSFVAERVGIYIRKHQRLLRLDWSPWVKIQSSRTVLDVLPNLGDEPANDSSRIQVIVGVDVHLVWWTNFSIKSIRGTLTSTTLRLL